MKLLIEGWRFIPHSYACVNMWQCLELMKRDNIRLYHNDKAYYHNNWKSNYNVIDSFSYALLDCIPSLKNIRQIDVIYRIHCPFNLKQVKNKKVFVFITSEYGNIIQSAMIGCKSLKRAHSGTDVVVITPSNWSKNGLLRSGADQQRVKIIPLGVDTCLFKPLHAVNRAMLRKKLGWEGKYVFLNIGAMTSNKGIHLLLKAFSVVNNLYPDTMLCLKGTDSLYSSIDWLKNANILLTMEENERVSRNLLYYGKDLSFADIACLYQAADAYVSPYMAEGFNLPVLEAAASGLPIICTSGGPTDDFTLPSFAFHIDSILDTSDNDIFLQPSLEHLIHLMKKVVESSEITMEARSAGPAHVQDYYTWEKVVDRMLDIFTLHS